MLTRLDYKVNGKHVSEAIYCVSAFSFNSAVLRILKIADHDSLTSTTVH